MIYEYVLNIMLIKMPPSLLKPWWKHNFSTITVRLQPNLLRNKSPFIKNLKLTWIEAVDI